MLQASMNWRVPMDEYRQDANTTVTFVFPASEDEARQARQLRQAFDLARRGKDYDGYLGNSTLQGFIDRPTFPGFDVEWHKDGVLIRSGQKPGANLAVLQAFVESLLDRFERDEPFAFQYAQDITDNRGGAAAGGGVIIASRNPKDTKTINTGQILRMVNSGILDPLASMKFAQAVAKASTWDETLAERAEDEGLEGREAKDWVRANYGKDGEDLVHDADQRDEWVDAARLATGQGPVAASKADADDEPAPAAPAL